MTQQILLPAPRRITAAHYAGKRLPGSSRAQVIVDEAGKAWVVKSINSQQGHVLGLQASFNDYLAGRIAEAVGLNVAKVAIMELDTDFLDNYHPELRQADLGGFTSGLHFANEFHQGCSTMHDFQVRHMLAALQSRCVNRSLANNISAFDSATANADRAHVENGYLSQNLGNMLLRPVPGGTGLELLMIDNGFCFMGDWNNRKPPVAPHSVGAWPDTVFGMLKALALLGWYNMQDMQAAALDFNRVTLRIMNEIVDEIPASWKRFTNPANINEMLHYLIQRFAHYDTVIAQVFALKQAMVIAG